MKRITCRTNWYTVPKDKGKICAQRCWRTVKSITFVASYKKGQIAIVFLMLTFKTCSILKPTSWSHSYMLVFMWPHTMILWFIHIYTDVFIIMKLKNKEKMCFQKMESMKRLVMNPLTTENQQQNANINYRKQFVRITTEGYNEFFLKYLIHFYNEWN